MNLLDRFSSHLRDVLARSIHLATELKNPSVEPVHLLFAISNQKGSVAAEILNRFNLTPKTLEKTLLGLPIKKETVLHSGTPGELLTPLSAVTKAVLEKALHVAEEHGHNYIGTEHLLSALFAIDSATITEILTVYNVKINDLEKQVQTVLHNAGQFPQLNEVSEVIEKIEEQVGDGAAPDEETPLDLKHNHGAKKKDSALEFFALNLTGEAQQSRLDPVIGRAAEIERLIHIICRRTKNNPLLLGEPGVGKTAIVEGLAKRIAEGDVPDILLNKKIYSLDMGLLIAGTIYRGEFEARLRQIIEEASKNPNIILFIDEIHNIVGAGANQGAMDAANILKPALARGHLRCIGATTPQEYKKYIENDPALERRFQPIYALEPSFDDTILILQGLRKNYEAYHKVTITDEAILAAVGLADRYISNKFFPDKAIDLIDETSAAKRLTVKVGGLPGKLARLEQRLEKIIAAKETAAREDKFTTAVELKKEEQAVRAAIKKLTEQMKQKKVAMIGSIGENDVIVQLSKVIGTKPSELILNDRNDLEDLAARLKTRIVGQDSVIEHVAKHIRQAKLGLSNPKRPLASFLFVGESGVGKTELAKTIAEVLYVKPEGLIKLDMSEFNESFGVSKLLGSPAGYVGYKESNQFTDKLKMRPHSVLLFDEIDKAHRDVIKLLLQILENGEITDSTGKKISLRHTIIILTTTFGSDALKRGRFGFGEKSATIKGDDMALVQEKLKEFFTPEVVNRLDAVCLFNKLETPDLLKIADLELADFNIRLKKMYKTVLQPDQRALDFVIKELGAASGARDLRRQFRNRVETLMAEIILHQTLKKKYTLGLVGDKLIIR